LSHLSYMLLQALYDDGGHPGYMLRGEGGEVVDGGLRVEGEVTELVRVVGSKDIRVSAQVVWLLRLLVSVRMHGGLLLLLLHRRWLGWLGVVGVGRSRHCAQTVPIVLLLLLLLLWRRGNIARVCSARSTIPSIVGRKLRLLLRRGKGRVPWLLRWRVSVRW